MAYDPVRDEIVVPGFYNFSILTFRADANGDVSPVRKILGPSTQLANPRTLGLDAVHGKYLSRKWNAILFWSSLGTPMETPSQSDLETPRPSHLTVDPVRNLMIVTTEAESIYDRMASGNAKPLRFITGSAKNVGLITNNPQMG